MTVDAEGRPVGPSDQRRERGRRDAAVARKRFPTVELATGLTILTVLVGVVAIVVVQVVLAGQQQAAVESAVVRLSEDMAQLNRELAEPDGLPTRREVIEAALRVDAQLAEVADELTELRELLLDEVVDDGPPG